MSDTVRLTVGTAVDRTEVIRLLHLAADPYSSLPQRSLAIEQAFEICYPSDDTRCEFEKITLISKKLRNTKSLRQQIADEVRQEEKANCPT